LVGPRLASPFLAAPDGTRNDIRVNGNRSLLGWRLVSSNERERAMRDDADKMRQDCSGALNLEANS
jgi:hypothetical protein